MHANRHEFIIGPEQVKFFPKYKELYSELYYLFPVGINISYQYILNSKWKKINYLINLKNSFCKMRSLKNPETGTSQFISIQLIQFTGGIGVQYTLNQYAAFYGIIGILSMERTYPIYNLYTPNIQLGVKYVFD